MEPYELLSDIATMEHSTAIVEICVALCQKRWMLERLSFKNFKMPPQVPSCETFDKKFRRDNTT